MFCVEPRVSGEPTPSNHAFESHPPHQPYNKADNRAEKGTGNAVTPPQQRAEDDAEHEARTAEDQQDEDHAARAVEDADVRHPLALLPPTPMPRRTARGARGGPELRAGLAGVGGLEDLAAGAGVVGRGFARRRAVGAEGQGFRAVHFVEMGFVDFRGATTR